MTLMTDLLQLLGAIAGGIVLAVLFLLAVDVFRGDR